MQNENVLRSTDSYRWENVPVLNYKPEGNTFEAITRQVLFDGHPELSCQFRYFEIDAGGHSTLERHQHVHLVMIIRGRGRALLGQDIVNLKELDVVTIPPHTWHQFRATEGEPFGFLCLVNTERDRPILPSQEELMLLRSDPAVGDFIRV